MISGIKTYADGDYCINCDNKIESPNYNFCPICGNPLNVNASKLVKEQQKKVKIELLDELSFDIQDEKSLKVILDKVKTL